VRGSAWGLFTFNCFNKDVISNYSFLTAVDFSAVVLI